MTRLITTDSPDRTLRGSLDQSGFTLVELLIASGIFLLVLVSVGTLLVTSTRAYGVTAKRSEAIQDSEAVLQLMRYEVALAGYRGLGETTHDQPFTTGGDQSIVVRRTSNGDELTVRYFEDRYLGAGDSGERAVTFRVDPTSHSLVRLESRPTGAGTTTDTTELLVGNIQSMVIVELVDRLRERYSIESLLADSSSGPQAMAGVNVRVTFLDGLEWEFLIGVSNTQTYSVESAT